MNKKKYLKKEKLVHLPNQEVNLKGLFLSDSKTIVGRPNTQLTVKEHPIILGGRGSKPQFFKSKQALNDLEFVFSQVNFSTRDLDALFVLQNQKKGLKLRFRDCFFDHTGYFRHQFFNSRNSNKKSVLFKLDESKMATEPFGEQTKSKKIVKKKRLSHQNFINLKVKKRTLLTSHSHQKVSFAHSSSHYLTVPKPKMNSHLHSLRKSNVSLDVNEPSKSYLEDENDPVYFFSKKGKTQFHESKIFFSFEIQKK